MGPHSFSLTNPLVTALFRHGLFVVAVTWIVGLAVVSVLALLASGRLAHFNAGAAPESRRRRYLRLAFAGLWLVAGVLQFQSAMPLGMATDVVAPSADGAPSALAAVVHAGVGVWNNHPLALSVAVAWFQVGLAVVLAMSSGRAGRLVAGLSSLYALFIWVVGNAAGGLFSATSSLLFGWPGATLLYAYVGFWLWATPARFDERFAAVTRRAMALLLFLGAVLQALPSRGFWHGGNTNALTDMSRSMAAVAQPSGLAWFVRHTGVLAGTMGGGFNLLIILWLVTTAVLWWRTSGDAAAWSTATFGVLGWVAFQDTGLFGGLATDVNTLLPLALIAVGCLHAWSGPPNEPRLPRELRTLSAGVLATFGVAMMVLGLAIFAFAPLRPAETTLFVAVNNGGAIATHHAAPGFTLTDQNGHTFSLASTRGHVTVLSFLDPVCWTDCPLLANQMAALERSLSPSASVRFVAVAANPRHYGRADIRHFIARRHLDAMRHFVFVTGPLPTLQALWHDYGIGVSSAPKGQMSVHSNYLFVLDQHGTMRFIVPDEPLSTWAGENAAVSELRRVVAQLGVA